MKQLPHKDTTDCEDAADLPAVLFAYRFDGKGGATALDTAPIQTYGILPGELYWVHLFLDHPDTKGWLDHYSGLDEHTIDALTQQVSRPRLSEKDDGSLIILRGVNTNPGEEPEDMVSIRMYVDKKRIISVRKRKLAAVHDMREALARGRGPETTGEFVAMMTDYLCNHMDPTLSELNEDMDDAEAEVLESPETVIRERIADIRKQAIIFHRYLAPQRDALARIRISDHHWLGDDDRKLLIESYDRVTRFVEDLDAIRERAQIVHDELGFALSSRLNKNTFVLSIVSAIFLPLTFITGLLGMNVEGIPAAGSPRAFMVITALLCFCAATQVFLLRRMRWF